MPLANGVTTGREKAVHALVKTETYSKLHKSVNILKAFFPEENWSQGLVIERALEAYLPELEKRSQALMPATKPSKK